MREKLENFVRHENAQNTESSFWECFRFLKTEGSRNKLLKRLREWNRGMDIFVQRACKAAERNASAYKSQLYPSSQLRTLSRRLFSTLSRCWTCQCTAKHHARVSLDSCDMPPKTQLCQSGLFFEFLISHMHVRGQEKWSEAKVTINAPE
jgi:hypothetical protein